MKTKKPKETPTDDAPSQDPTPAAATPKRKTPTLEFLPVRYTDAETLHHAHSLARANNEKTQIEEQFETIKLDFKHRIEAIGATIRDLTRKIDKGVHYENVECYWILETPTPGEKTLIRSDGQFERVVPMASHDYQDRLPIVLKPEDAGPDPVDKTEAFALAPPANGKAAEPDKEPETGPPVH